MVTLSINIVTASHKLNKRIHINQNHHQLIRMVDIRLFTNQTALELWIHQTRNFISEKHAICSLNFKMPSYNFVVLKIIYLNVVYKDHSPSPFISYIIYQIIMNIWCLHLHVTVGTILFWISSSFLCVRFLTGPDLVMFYLTNSIKIIFTEIKSVIAVARSSKMMTLLLPVDGLAVRPRWKTAKKTVSLFFVSFSVYTHFWCQNEYPSSF